MRLSFILLILFFIPLSLFAQKKTPKQESYFDETVDETIPNIFLNTLYSFVDNPAMAGFEKRKSLILQYRVPEFRQFKVAPLQTKQYPYTSLLGLDAAFGKNKNISTGILVESQRDNGLINNNIQIPISFKYVFWNTHFRLGLHLGYRQLNFNSGAFTANSLFPFDMQQSKPSEALFHIEPGILIQRYNYYLGLHYKYIFSNTLSPDQTTYIMGEKLKLFTTYAFTANKWITLHPFLSGMISPSNKSIFAGGISIELIKRLMLLYQFSYSGITQKTNNKFHFSLIYSKSIIFSFQYSSRSNLLLFHPDLQASACITWVFGSSKKNMFRWSKM